MWKWMAKLQKHHYCKKWSNRWCSKSDSQQHISFYDPCVVHKEPSIKRNATLIEEAVEEEEAYAILQIPPMQQRPRPELSIQICHTSDHCSSFSFESEKETKKLEMNAQNSKYEGQSSCLRSISSFNFILFFMLEP